jgi:hypothetical protein
LLAGIDALGYQASVLSIAVPGLTAGQSPAERRALRCAPPLLLTFLSTDVV